VFYKKKRICYIPKLTNKIFTGEDIIEVCKKEKDLAEFVFEIIDWQHPSTVFEELKSFQNQNTLSK